jgi:hypothetical protein
VLLAIATAIAAVQATVLYDRRPSARHPSIARRAENPLAQRAPSRRCPHRAVPNTPGTSSSSPSSHNKPLQTHAPPPPPPPPPAAQGHSTIHADSSCGSSGATRDITHTSGPMGSENWLNCGIDGSGWNPPHVQVSDLIVADLGQATRDPNSPFQACKDFIHLFEQHGNEVGIPPILLASFALQESSCKPNTVGGAGEQGLMQLTRDKCGGAPNGNCRDPDFNVRTAARYFKATLADCGGNVIQAVGTYNGWHRGLTIGQATAAASTACCRCQNNLDYLHQFFNGWCQNVDAYSHNLGQYHNLDQC